jgi:hypothetical protein
MEMRAAALKGIFSAALRAKNDIVTKVIPQKDPAPVDKGIYRAGWQVEKLRTGAAIYNPVPYAAAIEYGVSAGNVVFSNKFQKMLAEWVNRKLGGRTPKQAWSIAGAIMHSLKTKGIFKRGVGLRVLEGYSRTTLLAVLREEVTREIEKALRG